MSQISNIEWTEATWNFLAGCDKVSPGCKNCYAINDAWRMAHNPNEKMSRKFLPVVKKENGKINWTGEITFTEDALLMPLRIRKPTKFFVNSLSDLFHKDVKDEWIERAFAVMADTPRHIYQILTKRPERALDFLRDDRHDPRVNIAAWRKGNHLAYVHNPGQYTRPWPLPNVWLGVSVEDQQRADERIPLLLQTPAAVRWLSMEPLLGPVSLRWLAAWRRADGSRTALRADAACGYEGSPHTNHLDGLRELDWIVVGGESGSKSRPTHPDWIRTLRDQCQEADVPFFFKQWGAWSPYQELAPLNTERGGVFVDDKFYEEGPYPLGATTSMTRYGKKKSGRWLDGQIHDEFPLVTDN